MLIAATIGKKIKAARRSKKISQCRLAQSLNISEGYLSHLETGKNTPSIELLLNLCNLLELTPNDLLLEPFNLMDHSSFSSLYHRFSNLTPDERIFVCRIIVLLENKHLNQHFYQEQYQPFLHASPFSPPIS